MRENEGEIKRLLADKGFGFIRDTAGVEWFFHRTAVDNFNALREGQRVTFSEGRGPKGPRAEHVRRA